MNFFFSILFFLTQFSMASNVLAGDLCKGQRKLCYDYCSNSRVFVYNGDTCTKEYDRASNCFRASSLCSKNEQDDACKGQNINCYDPCTDTMVRIANVNQCGIFLDRETNCRKAYGYCELK